MTRKGCKAKGSNFERELVNEARATGLAAERAYASNGRALGCAETVDCVIQGCRIQAKRRARINAVFKVPTGADAVVFREDRGETFVLLRWEDFKTKLKSEGW